MKIMKGE